jgi:hypothetical protein
MSSPSRFPAFIVHYSPLMERAHYLKKVLSVSNLEINWITENDYLDFPSEFRVEGKIVGVTENLVGMDLGINSRSLKFSRRRARLQGVVLLIRSKISGRKSLINGSLPKKEPLGVAQIEIQRMHLTALSKGLERDLNWILVLEDDIVPIKVAFDQINKLLANLSVKNTWVNLNSGAGLKRTKSEKKSNRFGLFRVRPASTRCAVAYLVSKDLAKKIVDSALKDGIPDWLPIDVYYQVLLRKFKSKSYWADPAIFEQGSENGRYLSNLERFR